MIEIRSLQKSFRSGRSPRSPLIQAVSDVSLNAPNACITGLLGPNGAGKTTTLRIAAGLMQPDAGVVMVDGIDVARQPRLALQRLGVLSDARGLYTRLTAQENILYFAGLHGVAKQAALTRLHQLAGMLEMRPLLDRRTEGFSQGERMKTALARALIHDPANIILDEPTNGLDVLATRSLRAALCRLRDEAGKCIVFSTHIMQEVERLCDQVILIAHGRTVASGTVSELNGMTGQADFESTFVQLAFRDQLSGEAA